MNTPAPEIRTAEVVLPCRELHETLAFFTGRLGFRVAAIFPADDPSVAVIAGHGLRVRLERGGAGSPGLLRLACDDPRAVGEGAVELTAPNGTRVELVPSVPPLRLPPLQASFVLTRGDSPWGPGRAGMLYRDLVPDRQGGRVIASHIRIPEGGPVPDYVHFHRVRFQMIYCYQGWVRVVYEDQGPPFVLQAGDSVLQPPGIRHRVLESGPGLEVLEISSPAEHETLADLEMALPTPRTQADRDFGGQRFVRHEAALAEWSPWRGEGFEARDLGIDAATRGLAGAHVVRSLGGSKAPAIRHEAELLFTFVLGGSALLECEGRRHAVRAGDSFVVPAGLRHALGECARDLQILEVSLPARFTAASD